MRGLKGGAIVDGSGVLRLGLTMSLETVEYFAKQTKFIYSVLFIDA
jgi:hypothetical protein